MRGVLLLAPVGLDHGCWQLSDLGEVQTVAHDLPGFGGRPRWEGRATMQAWVADVVERLEESGADGVDVVGCSLGAMVAQNLALARPDLVRSLLLACTGASAEGSTMAQRARRAETVGMEGMIDETLERWFTPGALGQPGHRGVAYARSTLLALEPGAFADGWRVVGDHDVTAELGKITAPTTCVAAREDRAAPLERVQQLARGVPGSRLVVLPGAHMVHLEDPERFSAAVRAHLAWARSASPREVHARAARAAAKPGS